MTPVHCHWKLGYVTQQSEANPTTWQAIDVFFSQHGTDEDRAILQEVGGDTLLRERSYEGGNLSTTLVKQDDEQGLTSAMVNFLTICLRGAGSAPGDVQIARFIVPLDPGMIIRSDIIPLRLQDSLAIEEAVSFATSLQVFPSCRWSEPGKRAMSLGLMDVFRASAGAILPRSSGDKTVEKQLATLDLECKDKLSIPWILPGPVIGRKRMALIGASVGDPTVGWIQWLHRASVALGIDLVVIDYVKPDAEGHWLLQNPQYADWCVDFLPFPYRIDLPPTEDAERLLVTVLDKYGVERLDGVMTRFETYSATVARVATRLGFPTQPAEACEIATDKNRLAVLAGRESFRGSSVQEAIDYLEAKSHHHVPHKNLYPLIVKPCQGWSSEMVTRVEDSSALLEAVDKVVKTSFCPQFALEKYCAGPEVDINFILLDGEVLFCEVCDDFPKGADASASSTSWSHAHKDFLETMTVFPSALPRLELDMLQGAMQDIVRRLGFSTGILHIEARIDGSSVEYRPCPGGSGLGIVDLDLLLSTANQHKRTTAPPAEAEAEAAPFILEINPRPPGMTGTRVIQSVYGIDYYGIALLAAINDKVRLRALAQPFRQGQGLGSQYTGIMVFIRADYHAGPECKGIFDSGDICEELMARKPELVKNVTGYGALVKRGDKVKHPSTGINEFVAYFNVASESRLEALKIAKVIREEVRYQFR